MPDQTDNIDERAATVVHNLGEAIAAVASAVEHLADTFRHVDPDNRMELAQIIDDLDGVRDRIARLAAAEAVDE
jgi:hypothetical protein